MTSDINKIAHRRKMTTNVTNVYIDGACVNNGYQNAKAGYAVYFGTQDDPRNEAGRVQGKQSNNTGELTAFIRCLEILQEDIKLGTPINIYTDSEYVMKCATSYGGKAKDDAPNIELVRKAYALFKSGGLMVKLHHIRAHTNLDDVHSQGNAEADRMAGATIGITDRPESRQTTIKLDWITFDTKDAAKKLGAKWNASKKFWYVESEENMDALNQLRDAQMSNRDYVKISYADRDKAKASGALWDPVQKSWYYNRK